MSFMDNDKKSLALELHQKYKGKLTTALKLPINNKEDLAMAYTPGVAEPSLAIASNPEASYDYTARGNTVAVISDGSAVLGLGNLGALGAMPVMEGKCALFKKFADIDAWPLVLNTQDQTEIINIVRNLAPSFGGINLEDISAPRCFEIEEALQDIGIPVFHDDQHGTAIVVLAGLINALKVVNKSFSDIKVVVAGAGSAGIAIVKLLLANSGYSPKDIVVCDSRGVISKDRLDLNLVKQSLLNQTNRQNLTGGLSEALIGADVFIGVSAPNTVTPEMVNSMSNEAIVFGLSNPVPEIMPDIALKAGAKVVATGRSDFPNQINNVLAFPGIFRGALDYRLPKITTEMKLAVSQTLANLVTKPKADNILPDLFDKKVVPAIKETLSFFK